MAATSSPVPQAMSATSITALHRQRAVTDVLALTLGSARWA